MIRRNVQATVLILTFVLTIFLVSCNPARSYEKKEKQSIDDYLSKNPNENFVKQPSGLYYFEIVKGTGISPVMGDSAWVNFTGMYLNGNIFSSNVSSGKYYSFILGENISGFDEGLTLMAVGGKSTILVPSSLGYGTYGKYPIQGYTALLYDLELVRVKRAAGK